MSSAIFIDGNSLLHRAFYALPTTMKTKDGRYTNAVYGFINMLLTLHQIIIHNISPLRLMLRSTLLEMKFTLNIRREGAALLLNL